MKPLVDYVHTAKKSIRYAVRQRAAGYQVQFNLAGIQHRKQIAAPNANQAKIRARELVLKALDAAPALGTLPLATAVARYLADRWPGVPRDRTRTDHQNRLNTFTAHAGGDTDLGTLDYNHAAAMIQKYFAARKAAGDIARSLINHQAVLHRFCRWLLTTRSGDGRTLVNWQFNPARREEHQLDAPPKGVLPAPNMEMIGRFMAAARNTPAWPYVLLSFGGGLRACEIARAQWQHLDVKFSTILAYGKNRPRLVKLSADVMKELKALRGAANTAANTPESYIAATRSIRKDHNAENGHRPPYEQMRAARKAAGLPDWVNFQSLRRAAARFDLKRLRVDQYAQRLGHNLRTASEHYQEFDVAPASQNVLQIPAKALKESKARAKQSSTKTSTAATG